jgi:NAD(P)-dependent dehydrogenase (short-subunit alcohol dehydrogenase family)
VIAAWKVPPDGRRWPSGGCAYQPISEYDVAAARSSIESKLIGPLLLTKHGPSLLAPGGSTVFPAGIAANRPDPRRRIGRIGRTKDIADAIIVLLRNGFITGTVLHAWSGAGGQGRP